MQYGDNLEALIIALNTSGYLRLASFYFDETALQLVWNPVVYCLIF